jgi:hypothetical protein
MILRGSGLLGRLFHFVNTNLFSVLGMWSGGGTFGLAIFTEEGRINNESIYCLCHTRYFLLAQNHHLTLVSVKQV